jgi:hypothetical protein
MMAITQRIYLGRLPHKLHISCRYLQSLALGNASVARLETTPLVIDIFIIVQTTVPPYKN